MHASMARLFVSVGLMALHTGALAQGLSPAPVGTPAIDQGVAPADPAANATTTPQAPSAADGDGFADIIVNAQRRDESLQDVPLSVQVFSAAQLQNKGASSFNDLPNLVPGVSLVVSGPSPRVFIRGVGNSNNASSGGTVVTMIDGVYQPFLAGIPQLIGVSGVEVDKGPQGTLFGRNATGGAIQISTRSPEREPTFEAHLGYANYDTISGDVYGATALSDKVRASVSGYFTQRRDGWGVNRTTGADVYTDKQYGARTKWQFDVSDATSLEVIGDYLYSRFDVGTTTSPPAEYPGAFDITTLFPPALAPAPLVFPGGVYDVLQNYGPKSTASQGGVSAKITSHISDGIVLTSTSFWRKTNSDQAADYDGGPVPFGDVYNTFKREGLSQELQLASDKGERLNWVAGVFYYHENADITSSYAGPLAFILQNPSPPSVPLVMTIAQESTDTIAAYGQVSYEFLPGTTLTLGGRYTEDKRVTGGDVLFGGPGTPPVPGRSGEQSKNFKKFTYRVALDHKITDDVLVYASTSTGFNAGGFLAISPAGYAPPPPAPGVAQNPRYEPEEITAYEVGIKANFLDSKVRANIAAFWYDYANLQQSVYGPNALIYTTNAGKARMKGVDFELSARPTRNLTLSLNGEYLDAKYRSYTNAPGYARVPFLNLLTSFPLASVPGNGGVGAAGKRVIYAPEWSLSPDVTFVIPTEIGEFSTSASLQFRTKSYVDPNNDFFIKEQGIVNVSERWNSPDEKTDIRLWVNNLTNKKYSQSIKFLEPFGLTGDPAPPRTYGITVGHKF